MAFPVSHPIWMWLYFGTFGTLGAVLFTLVMWHWMKVHALVKGSMRSSAKWSAVGFMFLFIASWFACGIGGPPGNLLSSDPTTHNLSAAIAAATASMFFSVPGWVCVLVSLQKMIRGVQSSR